MADLAEKYRPKCWEEVINQDKIVASLQAVLAREEGPPHAFLFTGPKGCGKTTIGELIRDYLGVTSLNYNYYNTSNTRGIDTIREIDQKCKFRPMGGELYRYYLMDECAELTKSAQNAFLPLLERSPKHVIFCLCTTDPEKLLPTIRDRCSIYAVNSFTRIKLVGLLRNVCVNEGINFTPKLFREIADVSEGSARNALKILDQVIGVPEEEARTMILDASVQESQIIDICKCMLEGNKDWVTIASALKSINAEPEQIRRAVVNYLGRVQLNKKQMNPKWIGIINIMSDSQTVMYSGLGGLVGLIGLSFEVYN